MPRSILQSFKTWLDGSEEDSLRNMTNPAPPRKADEFMTRVAQRLDMVLQDEMFVPLNREAQTPSKFIVFLNKTDDVLWQSAKRQALQETLSELIFERAKELASPSGLSVTAIEVLLKVDDTLVHPMFNVVPMWVDEESFPAIIEQPTVIDKNQFNYSEISPLFTVSLFQNDSFNQEFAFYKNKILIGRGSGSAKVDIQLIEPNISRVHASLVYQESGKFILNNLGKNNIIADEEIIYPESTCYVTAKQKIKIAGYTLSLQKSKEKYPVAGEIDRFKTQQSL